MTTIVQEIPLNQLVPSKKNVRRTGGKDRIEELAASIASKGVLQNLIVCPVEGEKFEVIAGGRRLKALKLLVKQKQFPKDGAVRCMVREEGEATEVSLAENFTQAPMHPADQFDAFKALQDEGMGAEDIAARFGISPTTVTQRLKLAAVSPKLMKTYRAGEMNLDQLSAFAITDDHALQERVWKETGSHTSRHAILRALTETQVPTTDRRVLFVGLDAYEGAGGALVRDLFDAKGGGFLTDADLLNRLVSEKLAGTAESVSGEGWKWVEARVEFDYGAASGMRRVYPDHAEVSEETQAQIDELEGRAEALSESSDEYDEAIEQELARLDAEVASLRGEAVYGPEEIAMAGVFVSLNPNGEVRIERGLVKPEDDIKRQDEAGEAKPARDKDALPDSLKVELSVFRTAALGNELAQKPDVALLAVIHGMAAEGFFPLDREVSALTLSFSEPRLVAAGESRAVTERQARHQAWAERMPEQAGDLWGFVAGLAEGERLALLAHCASLSVDAVVMPKGEASPAAAMLAEAVALDMTGYWQPTAEGYFSRVGKSRILKDVREAASPEDAQTCDGMKKADMAKRAEKLVGGKGWLPEQLR
jgi:ParB family transcriptional regulator, chromosome partitioning protein